MRTPAGRRLLLAAVLGAGFLLRLFRLGAESLWYDETVSAYLAGSAVPELLRHTAGDIHPPGYYLLLRGWLLLAGYPDGRAALDGHGLEWMSGFFSVFFGVALIALAYVLACRLAGGSAGLWAAAIVAFSPFSVWYSQEVRMYTLAACLSALAIYAAVRASRAVASQESWHWWGVYALAAAGGMYTLYYFVFLLLPLNAWAGIQLARGRVGVRTWTAANIAVLLLYLPWLPNALRQALDPPVPPWRIPVAPWSALGESWRALSLGQSAPPWTAPISILMLAVFVLGVVRSRERAALLWTALGPPALILLLTTLVTPLYHVRYMFTYSPPVFAAMAAGMASLWSWRRAAATVVALAWLAGTAATLRSFWFDPAYRADDHRGAVAALSEGWRPGDALLVNAGYAYPAIVTYWPGEIAGRTRLTSPLPEPRDDDALVMITTGHVNGDPGLGWGDPSSDFFGMPGEAARSQIEGLFENYGRVWHYRIYDTVSDPEGLVRASLDGLGVPLDDRVFTGEANLRLQAFAPDGGVEWGSGLPEARVGDDLAVQWEPISGTFEAGDRLLTSLNWRPDRQAPPLATSVRLVDDRGGLWAQPPDEHPLGPLFPSEAWPAGQAQHQGLTLEVPIGTPPGDYTVQLLAYDPGTGVPYQAIVSSEEGVEETGLTLGRITVAQPESSSDVMPYLAAFGPLRLIEGDSPATEVAAGGAIPVSLLWQGTHSPMEPLVVVVQLLDSDGHVVAGLEEEPVGGGYPTSGWAEGEAVRDPHTLDVPPDTPSGDYRLIVGIYRAADRVRLPVSGAHSGVPDAYLLKEIHIAARSNEGPPGV